LEEHITSDLYRAPPPLHVLRTDKEDHKYLPPLCSIKEHTKEDFITSPSSSSLVLQLKRDIYKAPPPLHVLRTDKEVSQ
ncbi:hypothetical protein PFDG_04889, partial [Plasmodium falciparum Dd2]